MGREKIVQETWNEADIQTNNREFLKRNLPCGLVRQKEPW